MSRMIKAICIAAVAQGAAMAAQAQDAALPDYAYDTMTTISLANTAASACPMIETSPKGMNKSMTKMIKQLIKDGVDPAVITPHFESEYGVEQLEYRANAFRAQHGVSNENDAAFCEAIKAEAKDDRSFKKLMKISR
ncbi:MAG: DUF5333 family protein [Paracoccaceae bacterium]